MDCLSEVPKYSIVKRQTTVEGRLNREKTTSGFPLVASTTASCETTQGRQQAGFLSQNPTKPSNTISSTKTTS